MESIDLCLFRSNFLSSTVYFSVKVFLKVCKTFTFISIFLNSSHSLWCSALQTVAQTPQTLSLGWSQFRPTADCLVPSHTKTSGSKLGQASWFHVTLISVCS